MISFDTINFSMLFSLIGRRWNADNVDFTGLFHVIFLHFDIKCQTDIFSALTFGPYSYSDIGKLIDVVDGFRADLVIVNDLHFNIGNIYFHKCSPFWFFPNSQDFVKESGYRIWILRFVIGFVGGFD